MKYSPIILFLLADLFSFAQYPTELVKPQYYSDGKPSSISIYDSLVQKWRTTEYYEGGTIASELVYEENGFRRTDTLKAYFTNGNLVYKAIFKENSLHGELIEFYLDGKIKRRSEYFNCYMTGLWTEYYHNGQKKSEGKYVMSVKDSLKEDWNVIDRKRFARDSITYLEIIYDSVEINDEGKLKYEIYSDTTWGRIDVYSVILTPKDGIWKYWDEKGNLLREENYMMGIIEKRRKKKTGL